MNTFWLHYSSGIASELVTTEHEFMDYVKSRFGSHHEFKKLGGITPPAPVIVEPTQEEAHEGSSGGSSEPVEATTDGAGTDEHGTAAG